MGLCHPCPRERNRATYSDIYNVPVSCDGPWAHEQ